MSDRARPYVFGLVTAVALGLLEAAWTTPTQGGPGGPGGAMLGSLAILTVLLLTTWPRPWLLFGLAILQESIQGYVGTLGAWHPTMDTVFNHWSVAYLGMNVYPWILFPALTIVVEVVVFWRRRAVSSYPAW